MARKQRSVEGIIGKLREAEVGLAQGESVALAYRRIGVSGHTFYRWRQEYGYVESSGGKLRDELLDREVFDTFWEVQVLTEQWRHEYNRQRPHSSLGYRPPAPEAILTSSPAPRPISVS